MQLPYLENAQVEERKITGYLLSEDMSEGKVAFFTAFGFALARWDVLRDALMAHAAAHQVVRVVNSPFGTKYLIEGPLQTLDGRNPTCALSLDHRNRYRLFHAS